MEPEAQVRAAGVSAPPDALAPHGRPEQRCSWGRLFLFALATVTASVLASIAAVARLTGTTCYSAEEVHWWAVGFGKFVTRLFNPWTVLLFVLLVAERRLIREWIGKLVKRIEVHGFPWGPSGLASAETARIEEPQGRPTSGAGGTGAP